MSNIFTPFNPIFLIPLKVKYKGEHTKNAMNPQFYVFNWVLFSAQLAIHL